VIRFHAENAKEIAKDAMKIHSSTGLGYLVFIFVHFAWNQ